MNTNLRDGFISILDDYAEYVLGSEFSGRINQAQAIDEILEKVAKWAEELIGEDEPTIPGFSNNADLGEIEEEAVRNQLRKELRAKKDAL